MHKDIWQQVAKGIKAAKNLLQLNLSHLVLSHGGNTVLLMPSSGYSDTCYFRTQRYLVFGFLT